MTKCEQGSVQKLCDIFFIIHLLGLNIPSWPNVTTTHHTTPLCSGPAGDLRTKSGHHPGTTHQTRGKTRTCSVAVSEVCVLCLDGTEGQNMTIVTAVSGKTRA